MPAEIPEFQRYQLAFTARLRNPQQQPLPADVSQERMAVYEEIVFNNLFESVFSCFPVARSMLGEPKWLSLVQTFMRDYSANNPFFRSIPQQFLHYLNLPETVLPAELPAYFKSLCHYEWVELHIASLPTVDAELVRVSDGGMSNGKLNNSKFTNSQLSDECPRFTPAMLLLEYDYPVHRISPAQPPVQQSTHLLVYRNQDDEVKFMELNAVTHRFILLLQNKGLTGKQALTQIAQELQHPQPESIMAFGLSLLEELTSKGVIIGTHG